MKLNLILSLLISLTASAQTRVNGLISNGAVSVGNKTAADSKSILDVHSTTLGLLVPRMTTTQKNNISSPTTSLLVFDSTLGFYNFYTGSAWVSLVCDTCTQTLTNKTMSGVSNTFTNIPLTTAVTGTLPVGNGGTGSTTFALNGILYGNAGSAINVTAQGTQYQVLQAGSSNVPAWDALHLDQTAAVAGTLAIIRGGTGAGTVTTNGMLYGGATVIGSTAAGSQYQVFQAGGSGTPTIDAVHLDQAAATTGTLLAARLPNPTSSTLGGIKSKLPTTNQFVTSVSTTGDVIQAQPVCGDLSGNSTSGSATSSTFCRGDGAWAAPSPGVLTMTSQTANYSPAVDTFITYNLLGQAATTLTLPTATGNDGHRIVVIRSPSDTSFVELKIIGTSSQLVNGQSSYSMWTPNEQASFIARASDTSWAQEWHNTEMIAMPAGTISLSATTTGPTKPSGIAVDASRITRRGKNLVFHFEYKQSNTTSAADGSGVYLLYPFKNLGMTADTAETNINAATSASGSASSPGLIPGSMTCGNASGLASLFPIMHSSTTVHFAGFGTGATGLMNWSSTQSAYALSTGGASLSCNGWFEVPIVGWQP